MIVVDTSALVAILQEEPLADYCAQKLFSASTILISAGTLTEALIVSSRRNLAGDLERLVSDFSLEVVPVDLAMAQRCLATHARYGKGIHPAGLNFGDCFAYALAHERQCPLLFVGDDFSRTDIAPAI